MKKLYQIALLMFCALGVKATATNYKDYPGVKDLNENLTNKIRYYDPYEIPENSVEEDSVESNTYPDWMNQSWIFDLSKDPSSQDDQSSQEEFSFLPSDQWVVEEEYSDPNADEESLPDWMNQSWILSDLQKAKPELF